MNSMINSPRSTPNSRRTARRRSARCVRTTRGSSARPTPRPRRLLCHLAHHAGALLPARLVHRLPNLCRHARPGGGRDPHLLLFHHLRRGRSGGSRRRVGARDGGCGSRHRWPSVGAPSGHPTRAVAGPLRRPRDVSGDAPRCGLGGRSGRATLHPRRRADPEPRFDGRDARLSAVSSHRILLGFSVGYS